MENLKIGSGAGRRLQKSLKNKNLFQMTPVELQVFPDAFFHPDDKGRVILDPAFVKKLDIKKF